MQYETHFRKTFLDKPEAWKLFVDSVQVRDNHNIHCAVNHDLKDRMMIDSLVFSTYSPDLDLWRRLGEKPPEVGSAKHLEELEFVRELAANRDQKISDQPSDYPIGLRQVSYFLKDHTQLNFKPGVDYLNTVEELEHVYRGNKPQKVQEYGETGNIVTLRDGARFVRNDPAVNVWADDVVNDLLSLGVKIDESIFVKDYTRDSQFDFSILGGIDIKQLYWETAVRISRLSFRNKHLYMFPRPEQTAWDLGQDLLHQAFDRGAPDGHASFTAMHSAIYTALKELTILIFDSLHIMPNGKTVEYNTEVLKQNGQHWRIAAGVHYMMDNTSIEPLAKAVAKRVVYEHVKKVKSVR